MRRFKRFTGLAAALLVTVTAAFPTISRAAPQKGEPVVVGRVSHIEGQLLSYVTEEKDWVPILKDVPFGLEDTLYSDQDAKAEFIFPNSTWIRIGGSTQIQAIALDDEVTEVDVASGIARFYNRGAQSVIKATTPFGYVLAPAGAMFDLYVGDESLEVIALKGTVDFVHGSNESRYEVQSGSSSLVADNRQVTAGQGTVDADFDDWNAQRDSLWAKRLEVKGDSTRYLPSQLQDDAYELEENGRWERVQYEGEYRNLWRPTRVGAEWAPYSTGRWTTYYGDQCWVPYEPFGYTTHHYGSWVFIDASRSWYWAPPVPSINISVGRPWTVGYGWYPGRVSWIYSDVNVGWAPLAPYEPYYANHYWGPSSVAIASLNLASAVVNLATLHYVNHAIFVGHHDFWGLNNYHGHYVRNINRTTIINNYHGSPLINRTVFRDFDRRRDRFNFVDTDVRVRPHRSVVERIDRNQRLASRQERIEARTLLRDTRNVRAGSLQRDVRIERPKVSNRLVARDSVDRPLSDVRFQQRELKKQERQQRAVNERVLRPQQREERQQLQREERQQRQQEQREQRQGVDRVRPEKPSRETLEQRRQGREEQQQERQKQQQERLQQREQRAPEVDQRQQLREERQKQQQERLQQREKRAPEVDQRQQLREERQKQQQERLQQREQRAPEVDQRQQLRQERQQQQQERLQQREKRAPEVDQRQQLRQERQQQQQERLQQREQRAPEVDQRQQLRQERQQQQQERLQQREQRAPEVDQRQQLRQERQQQQQERQQQQMQQRQQMQEQRQQQQQEQPRQKKRPKGQEEQQQNGGVVQPQ